jgi:transposase
LNTFSEHKKEELKVVVLDNGAFHKAKALVIPDNIILLFLPPYSPELNPAEKIWAKFKRQFSNEFFKTIDQLQNFTIKLCTQLKQKEVATVCRFDYIFLDNYWSYI